MKRLYTFAPVLTLFAFLLTGRMAFAQSIDPAYNGDDWNLRAIVRDYGKIVLQWDGDGVLIMDTGLFAQSYTDWNRNLHNYQIKNSRGESEILNIDNRVSVYLPLIQK